MSNDQRQLRANVDRRILFEFKQAVEKYHGTRYEHISKEIEIAIVAHTQTLKKKISEREEEERRRLN